MTHVPPIARGLIVDMIERLGYDPQEVVSVTLDPDRVVVETYQYDHGDLIAGLEPTIIRTVHRVAP